MLPSERLPYSAITQRAPLKLPGGARMAVWAITNVEAWDATQPMPRTVLSPPAGGSPIPDIPNWCWHEYGNRVGFWRLLKVYDEFNIDRKSTRLNSSHANISYAVFCLKKKKKQNR